MPSVLRPSPPACSILQRTSLQLPVFYVPVATCKSYPSSDRKRGVIGTESWTNNRAWLSGNCAPDGKRAASIGILLTLTNIGGVVAGQIYQTDGAPRYFLGHGWSLGCLVFAWSLWWVVRQLYRTREEAKRAEAQALPEKKSSVDEQEPYTDRSASFKYII